jgi:hypothetical protein
MHRILSAMLAAASCATMAQAQVGPSAPSAQDAPVYTLDQAVSAAGGSAPAAEAATAAIDGPCGPHGRRTAAQPGCPRPGRERHGLGAVSWGPQRNPRSAAIPIELGGKRGARVAVANAQLSRAEIQAAIIAADVRLQVTALCRGGRGRSTGGNGTRPGPDRQRRAARRECPRAGGARPPRSNNSALMSRASMPTPMSSGSFVGGSGASQSGAPDRSAD